MGRKIKDVTLVDRGVEKTFRLTEMPAAQGERWALRVFLLLAKGGVEVPAEITSLGMAGLASMVNLAPESREQLAPELKQYLKGQTAIWIFNMVAGLDFAASEPLLAEMFACIQIMPSPNVVRPLIEDGMSPDIEDVATRLRLRAEVFELHTGFSIPGLRSGSPAEKEVEAAPVASPHRPRTRMSFKPSGRSSATG